jgi:hypothetical protein
MIKRRFEDVFGSVKDEGLPDLWDAEACAKWIDDVMHQEPCKLIGLPPETLRLMSSRAPTA